VSFVVFIGFLGTVNFGGNIGLGGNIGFGENVIFVVFIGFVGTVGFLVSEASTCFDFLLSATVVPINIATIKSKMAGTV